ncbi:GH39 family glycosyl hydrolase [Pseudoalteromonas sp. SIMBA_162]|uniref:GH39 family glycosyl hydrolase n=1 Tax=Pseudoalteromonas sp. SIMBA_162 TaxID=3080867 RepID=UPI00397B5875
MKLLQHTLITLCICISGCQSSATTELHKDNMIEQQNEMTHTFTADFTSDEAKLGEIYDFYDIAVRTERGNPKSKPATFGRKAKVNTVRMLGGWYNQDLTGDTYIWDGEKYVYNFKAATDRIDSWLESDWDIFQIVLDNPPWAFQRGYNFVNEPDGIHYLAKDRVGVYGNGLPPKDAKAWHNYISAFIKHLVSTYGEEKVNNWRFRIGSEIDTRPQHWAATQEEFFKHYQNTVLAIKSVLPNAIVGTHFREATHKSKYIDYTGNTEDAYAPSFVSWAKQNNVPYDFLAISYYPHITHPHEMDMHEVYQTQIAPILEHPDYNDDARFEIHEYKFIVKMKRAGFVSVATSHNSAFFAMLSKMMLEKNIKDVYQWGNARDGSYSPEAMTQLALIDMVGNTFYRNIRGVTQSISGNYIDGIFSQNSNNQNIDILMFSFNKENMEYQAPEPISLSLNVGKPVGTKFKYRVAQIDNASNIDQLFFADHPNAMIPQSQGGWRKDDAHPTASATNALNEAGLKVYKESLPKYGKINTLNWSEWRTSVTKESKGASTSLVEIDNTLPSFAVQKYQIQW